MVIGLMAIALQISLATVIYQGPLNGFLERAIALALIGAAVMGAMGSVLFGYRGTVAQPQNPIAVILALAAGQAVAGMADPASERGFATVAALVATTTLATGAIAWVLGRLRLGVAARFIPFPVVSGFLAATGYLLIMGGLGMTLGQRVQARDLGVLFDPGNPVRWLPWLLAGMVIAVVARRLGRPMALPVGLLLAGVAFYAALGALGLGLADAQRRGLLLGPFEQGFLPALDGWRPLAIDARALVAQVPGMLTAAGMCVIAMVMSASSIEVATGTHLDPDRELRAGGLCNLAAGLAGSPTGYHSLALTLLAHGLGVPGRAGGWIAAVACLLALTIGAPVIGALPVGLFATGIIVIGINMLVGPLLDQRRSLPAGDQAVVLTILAVTAAFGFLWGVAVGLLAAALLFIMAFARIDVVRLATTGARLRSLLERPDAEQARLAELGRRVAVYRLEGYIFFGTAHRLAQRVGAALDLEPQPRHVVVDFRRVRGIDTSAARALARLDAACRGRGIGFWFTGLDGPSERLVRGQLPPVGPGPRFAARLDLALEAIEAELLRAEPAAPADAPGFLETLRERHPSVDLDAYFRAASVPAGSELITQGAASDSLLVLRSGLLRTEVSTGGGAPVTVARCLPGALVGEIGLYAGIPRTARVTAEQPSEVMRIDAATLERMARDHPALLADFHRLIAATLARRLSRTTALLADSEI
jgi:SulP family sulfate permease